ncbi:MAG: hypothetical protein EXR72_14135 [Myxococcales bacterium]|nr:hypothetical protein [Myxococcales bacterium]
MRSLLLTAFLASAVAGSLAGCGPPPDPCLTLKPKFSEVKQNVFKVSCNFTSCHNAGSHKGMLDLETDAYAALLDVDPAGDHAAAAKSRGWKRIVASSPSTSYLYQKLTFPGASDPDLGKRMPESNPSLEQERLDQVLCWIRRGAPND